MTSTSPQLKSEMCPDLSLPRGQRDQAGHSVVAGASKFEEIVSLVYDLDHWFGESKDRLLFGKENIETVTPYAKMRAITVVYFPNSYHSLTELNVISSDYQIWLIKKAKKRHQSEGFEEIYTKFLDAQRKLLNELSSYVQNELRLDKVT
jgi:hypothetical protein